MNPWDIPPFPEHGDPSADLTFAAVGRATSEWERLELYLARLYAKFLGIPPSKAIAIGEYRDAANFHARAKEIKNAATKYFVSHPNQEREGEFERVVDDICQLASRRNDIVHGVVTLWWNYKETFSQAVDRNEHMLVPSTYSDKKFGNDREPKYLFRSIEIKQFADHFCRYRERLHAIIAFFPTL
jgi:hypothetical protein